MNITLFGATGRVGAVFLKKCLEEGHHVTVLVRHINTLPSDERLSICVGDAMNYEHVEEAIMSADLVVSALGTDGTTTLTTSMQHMIDSCLKLRISRIVSIGTAGILQSRIEKNKLRYLSVEARRTKTFAASEHAKVYKMLQQSTLDWTIVCPTALPMGERTGIYRVSADFLPEDGMRISVFDTADFTYDVSMNNLYVHKRVGIAY
ncbi:NAD(P)-dependent oxidoreductase [Kurthia senegalensis]|uniref:NAD(P)-dependent oxidoreductase n=1 Tax=Kurthia senegalensis TaxID=1033740 RepID=UPI000289D330|nr:NAD(P)H-binding protein [Kurthia senegalensis]